ncbi:MAG: DUF996 domain-containing protein, partial [Candidatus Bathyarchaeota archaeon]
KMTFESSKNLSAIGFLLIVIGAAISFVVSFSGILSIIGIILLLIGLKGLANFYKEDGIFNNALYSIIIIIVGCVVGIGVIAASAAAALADIGIDWANIEDWANVGTDLATLFADLNLSAIATLLGALLAGVIILFVFLIISMYFLRKSMDQLSAKSGVGLFGTAGILVLIGAVIPVIGLLIVWIGFILATVAFFQMKKEETEAP